MRLIWRLGKAIYPASSHPSTPVALPADLQAVFAANDVEVSKTGFGAEYLARIRGYAFDGGDTLTRTYYQKIRVLDDNGIAEFSTLEFDFDPSYEQLFVNRNGCS